MSDTAPQFDPEARICVREAIAYLRRLSKTHECSGRYCEHCVITSNLDKARRYLWPTDPLGEVDPESPYAGCPGKQTPPIPFSCCPRRRGIATAGKEGRGGMDSIEERCGLT